MFKFQSFGDIIILGAFVILVLGTDKVEGVYDITTIYKFAVPPHTSSYDRDIQGSCSHFECSGKQTGWTDTKLGHVKVTTPFSGDKYEVTSAGVTSIIPVPSDEFVISFRSSESKIFIFLLADADIIKSDMIMIEISSNSRASICQDYADNERQRLPNERSRKCFSTKFFYNKEYQGSNEYSSLFVEQTPYLKVSIPGDESESGLLPQEFYEAYKNEIKIKFAAIGVSSGSASFQLWSSFSTLSLTQPHGTIERTMSGSVGVRRVPECLSLKYYMQSNSGAVIKVLIEDVYRNQVTLGTVTASDKDTQVASLTVHNFIWSHENPLILKYIIVGEKTSVFDTVLISDISECRDLDFPSFITLNQNGSVEVHAMTNARGLPILLHDNILTSSFIGNNIEACTPLVGDCAWTVSNWSRSAEQNPPLLLQEKNAFTEYTRNNISTHYVFHSSGLKFTFQAQSESSDKEFAIFLMSNNPNIITGDMYVIERTENIEHYQEYEYEYEYGERHVTKIRKRKILKLNKCTSLHKSSGYSLPGEASHRKCNVVHTSDIQLELKKDCVYEIHLSSGNLNFFSICNSTQTNTFNWTDADPLTIVYYRFGSKNMGQFQVNTDTPLVWSLKNEEGSLTSPEFVPSSSNLCVSLTYYLPSTPNNSLQLNALWAGGDSLKFDTIQGSGEWKTERFTAKLPATKQDKLAAIELTARKSDGSNVFLQRIALCNGEGFEDVFVLSKRSPIDIQNSGYDAAMLQSKNNIASYDEVTCTNGGIFDEERGGCVCPSGFAGSTCEKVCGANRFGAACEGLCSKSRDGCRGMIHCRPRLGCSCAAGLRGFLCDKECRPGEYGAGCKQKCGHCKDNDYCHKYTGECPLGCSPGYYPPFCQQTYRYLSTVPYVGATEFHSFTVTADLNSIGRGVPRFYQFQYREAKHDSWLELEPRLISSDKVTRNITGLKSGIHYQVRVVLLDKDGDSYQGPNILLRDIITECTVPDSLHYDLQATETTENSFQITWKFVPESALWCAVTEFKVEHKEGSHWLKLYQGLEMTATLTNMLPGEQYHIRVQALTNGESYPFSTILTTTTKVGIPTEIYELHLVSSTSQELEVKWIPPLTTAGTIHRYKVSYKCQKLLACGDEDCSHSAGQVEVTATSIVLRGLLSHAQYSISVAALAASWGPATQLLAVTDMAVPGVTPDHNSTSAVTQRTNSSFTVQWKPPYNCTYLNGYLYGYRYEFVGQNNSMRILEGTTHLTTATFTNLIPHTRYKVRVFLVTSNGWSSSHPLEITVQTRATTPDPVEQLTVYKKSRRMLGVRWAAPKQVYGTLVSFTITYQEMESDHRTIKSVMKPTPCVAWPHLYCHMTNNLRADTQYTVLVQAQNAEVAEDGLPASVTAITKETAPLSPSFIRVVSQAQTNLTIEWGLPDILNGKLRSFLVNVEETDSFNSTECCQYFPVKEVAVQVEKSSYQLEFTELQPASTYAVSVSAKTVALGSAVSITAHTRPPIPSMDDMIEIPDNSISLPDSPTILIHPSTEYQDLISGYLLIVLTESNETKIPKTFILDDWLNQEVNKHVNGTYYFAAEYEQVDLEDNPEVTVGSGQDLKVGKWGEMQNPVLEDGMDYRLGLVLILDYCSVRSVGYTKTHVFHVDTVEHA